MDSKEAFDTLATHADKRHEHIIRAIGTDALMQSIEMNTISEDALVNLDDTEWERYLESSFDQDPLARAEDELEGDKHRDADVEFSTLAGNYFGMVDGYSLFGADEYGLIVHKSVLEPDGTDIYDTIRLAITPITESSITVRKIRQTIGHGTSRVVDLPATEEDEATAHRALERLKAVNASIDTLS